MRASVEKVIPGPLKNLEKILRNWTWLNREIIKSWEGKDCPWWYNERASISTLAGAVWHAGGIVFEEYSSRKFRGRRNVHGRCDLYFSMEHKMGYKEYVVEAKQCWLNAGSRAKDMNGPLQDYIDRACKDAKNNRPDLRGGEALLGVTFVVPRLPQYDLENEAVGERIKEVQDTLLGIAKKERGALAWIFPRVSRNMTSDDDGYTYPGTAVFIKQVR